MEIRSCEGAGKFRLFNFIFQKKAQNNSLRCAMVACITVLVFGHRCQKKLRTFHELEYMDLVDDSRYENMSDDCSGPEIEYLITFLCGCPELCDKT